LIEAASKGAASAIEEKVFYDNFKDVVMYVDHIPVKGKEKDRLKGVFIYEITDEGT
ncbi:hypothetical protein GWM83_03085, partial [Candidatus Bathyarchaeota archaeon]|nr:hypothetical protein [Candidatus Bathyarchaeota archaeon]NIW34528.1 hypothetical protein [Candidatus Bathyarchaeota archaeon]